MTDLQTRVQVIRDRAEELRSKDTESGAIKELCYLVDYLASILKKHLETGER